MFRSSPPQFQERATPTALALHLKWHFQGYTWPRSFGGHYAYLWPKFARDQGSSLGSLQYQVGFW